MNKPPGVGQESLRSDKKDENDPLADLPFWLEDFTDNLEDAEMPAPASFRESDLVHPVEVTKSAPGNLGRNLGKMTRRTRMIR